jgi:glycerol-3-phosphate acyltransferase PlsX
MMRVRVAVDAMGGDHAPAASVDGAVDAAQADVAITLVGAAAAVEEALERHPDWRRLPKDILDAPEAVGMAEPPVAALRRKRHSSIRMAADLVARGQAAALVSAGNTGATVVAAHAAFGMVPGVDRPAIGATIPTRRGPAVLLDAGATVECRPHHLVQFAVMGVAYARLALGIEQPRVGLLSIGEEETKGNALTRETHRLLSGAPVHFVGNVEGRAIYGGAADVVVCDGFTGNIVLKTSEGVVDVVEALLREELQGDAPSRLGYLLSRGAFGRFRRRIDYSEYGGAPLLGVAGLAIVAHGRSSPAAIRNAIALAARFASSGFTMRVEQDIAAAAVS